MLPAPGAAMMLQCMLMSWLGGVQGLDCFIWHPKGKGLLQNAMTRGLFQLCSGDFCDPARIQESVVACFAPATFSPAGMETLESASASSKGWGSFSWGFSMPKSFRRSCHHY